MVVRTSNLYEIFIFVQISDLYEFNGLAFLEYRSDPDYNWLLRSYSKRSFGPLEKGIALDVPLTYHCEHYQVNLYFKFRMETDTLIVMKK